MSNMVIENNKIFSANYACETPGVHRQLQQCLGLQVKFKVIQAQKNDIFVMTLNGESHYFRPTDIGFDLTSAEETNNSIVVTAQEVGPKESQFMCNQQDLTISDLILADIKLVKDERTKEQVRQTYLFSH